MICRAPSFPRIPGSVGLGLRSRPFFRVRNESIPPLEALPLIAAPSSPSAGRVELWLASSLQLPASSRTICTPPPLLIFRVAPRGREEGGRGRWKDEAAPSGEEGDTLVEGDGDCVTYVPSLGSRFSLTTVKVSF